MLNAHVDPDISRSLKLDQVGWGGRLGEAKVAEDDVSTFLVVWGAVNVEKILHEDIHQP